MSEAELIKTILGLGLGPVTTLVVVAMLVLGFRYLKTVKQSDQDRLKLEEARYALDKERTEALVTAVKTIHDQIKETKEHLSDRIDEHGEKLHAKVDRVIDKIDDKRMDSLTEVVRRLGPDESGGHSPPSQSAPPKRR